MDHLSGLTAFVRTADLGSFIAAGRVLGLSASAVGKSVARLEQQLGVRLFQRSTRQMQLTEEGRLFYERGRRILDDLQDATAMLAETRTKPSGRLRVSAPTGAYHLLMPHLPAFTSRYPGIELDLDFNNRVVDLIEEGVDVAIRSGELPDSRLMARPWRPFRLLLCAAPAYLARHGTPQQPRDLEHHLGIRFRHPDSRKLQPWPVIARPGIAGREMDETGMAEARIPTIIACNDIDAVCDAVMSGIGIGCLPDFLIASALATGSLQLVLEGHIAATGQFWLVWPSSRHLSPKVRVFVDFLIQTLAASPHANK
jgi:DNA-binding transcriptional LysR family regulator